jgi:hypothetical protein
MVDSSNIMAPLPPPAAMRTKRSPGDLPMLEAYMLVGTTSTTSSPEGPTQMPQDSALQTRATDNSQDSYEDFNGLEYKVSPMTAAITLQILGMHGF